MVMEIAWGIFVGFILIVALVVAILALGYVIGKKQDEVPHFIEKPKKRKSRASVQDWWDRYDDD